MVIGLALYALTILVRSMLEGFACGARRRRESATGLGYGTEPAAFRIELPLALPVIMAGLRVATVSTVALTTVGSLVAYGGLGNLIADGVQTNFRRGAVHRVGAVRAAGRPARRGAGRRPTADDPVDEEAAT